MGELASQIDNALGALNLKAMRACWQLRSEEASKGNLGYDEYLALLLEEEIRHKTDASLKARIGKAKFPFLKTMEGFDFGFQPELKHKEVIGLGALAFIESKNNVIFLGPPGVGKTHLSIALGLKACIAKYRVLFTSAQKLLEELMIAQRDGSLMERLLAYGRLNLLIIDELGYMPVSREQANLLFRLVSMRYEKGSIILTSNYNFDTWGNIFEDTVVAAAIIDRLLHHAHIFYITGSSYRIKDKLKKAARG